MKTLIIGCGYLGVPAAKMWLEDSHEVFALTRSENNANRFSEMGINPILGDIMNPESLESLPESDVVLYAVGLDRSQPHSMRDVYVSGLNNVLERVSQRTKRFLYVSSTSVYGQNSGEEVDENSICEPSRENGQICLEAEDLIRKRFHDSDVKAVVLRSAGLYGPERLLSRIDKIKEGMELRSSAQGWLNLVHVQDAAKAIFSCSQMESPKPTYLLCDDMPIRRIDYYSELARLANAPDPEFQSKDETALGKKCRNNLMKTELISSLSYPTYREGLSDILKT